MSETWSVAISYFSFIPVLHVLLSLATNAVLDGIGANVAEISKLLQDFIGLGVRGWIGLWLIDVE